MFVKRPGKFLYLGFGDIPDFFSCLILKVSFADNVHFFSVRVDPGVFNLLHFRHHIFIISYCAGTRLDLRLDDLMFEFHLHLLLLASFVLLLQELIELVFCLVT